MKHLLLTFVFCLLSVGAHAQVEEYSSAEELPEGSAIEALLHTASGRMTCPPGYIVAKQYCWNKKSFSFRHCGYFCNKIPPPPRHGKL